MSSEFGGRNNGGSRRRRGSPRKLEAQRESPQSTSTSYYYDDCDEDDGNSKGSHHQSSRMYGGACSLGRFFLNPCLCFALSARMCCHRILICGIRPTSRSPHRLAKDEYRIRRNILLMLILSASISGAFYVSLIHSDAPNRHRHLRPSSDVQLARVPVSLRLFDFSTINDLGGWMYPSGKFLTARALEKVRNDDKPDYGGLIFKSLANAPVAKFRRKINQADFFAYEGERERQLKEMDKHKVTAKYQTDEELEFSTRECRRTNWKSGYFPNCNQFHDLDLSRPFDEDSKSDDTDYDSYYFSHGYYRDVWFINSRSHDSVVLKLVRYKHKTDHRMMRTVQRDAVVMEKLTSSPRIVSIYGHCATSVYVEPVAYEVEEYIVPGSGYMKPSELEDSHNVNPQNDYNASEKLHMALEMAESIADLHGFKDGVIVHDDVQLCQWLRTKQDKLKLGDFNRAEIMDWNEEKKEYCKYNNGEAYGNYRAPEEFAAKDLDEKIDVFSFGNNIYALLTGLWVFYDTEDDEVTQEKIVHGSLPYVDDRYRNRTYAESKLVDIMERCWEFDPAKRVDIFDVVKFLRQAVEENTRLAGARSKQ